ncbi:MAG TPA: hypothetical protein VGA69_08500 [Nitriliruptorales bacterium]
MSEGGGGSFDPTTIVRVLDEHGVRYVVIGGVAARLHGSPTLTEDMDVTPERSEDNLRRLAQALAQLGARLAVPGVDGGLAVPLDQDTFSSPVMTFTTSAGEVDVVLEPAGTGGFEQLLSRAVEFEVFGVHVHVADLADIIASKETSDRPKDRVHLPLLRQLAEELERRQDTER